jgi:hypothetical protein
MECAQHIEAARERDDKAAIGRGFSGWTFHSLARSLCRCVFVDKGRASK